MEKKDLFFIIFNILVVGSIIYKVVAYISFNSKIKKGKYEMIKLSKSKRFNLDYVMYSVVWIGFGYFQYIRYSKELILFVPYMLITFVLIIDFFINPKNYFIINTIGFKEKFNGNLIKWKDIVSIDINTYNYKELILNINGKSTTLAFNSSGDIKKIVESIKKYSMETFNKYSDKLVFEE
jgi:hypothetical protein